MGTSRLLLVTLCFCGSVLTPVASAQNMLGLSCLENHTSLTRVNFEYQFGDGEWQSTSVAQNHWRLLKHWYDFANENAGPTLRIRFDADLSSSDYWVTYTLDQYSVPRDDCDTYGKKYRFTEAGNRINIVSTN